MLCTAPPNVRFLITDKIGQELKMEDLIEVVRLDGSRITGKAIEGFEHLDPSAEGATVQYGDEELRALKIGGVWHEWD
jgi:hypothetical protein